MSINVGMNADQRSAVSPDVVLVGAKLPSLSSHTLQLLLGRSVGVADLHGLALVSNHDTSELANDLVADVTALKSVHESVPSTAAGSA